MEEEYFFPGKTSTANDSEKYKQSYTYAAHVKTLIYNNQHNNAVK